MSGGVHGIREIAATACRVGKWMLNKYGGFLDWTKTSTRNQSLSQRGCSNARCANSTNGQILRSATSRLKKGASWSGGLLGPFPIRRQLLYQPEQRQLSAGKKRGRKSKLRELPACQQPSYKTRGRDG